MADVSAGVVTGTIEFEDKASDTIAGVEAKLSELTSTLEAASTGFGTMAAAVFSGEAALEAVEATAKLVKDAIEDVIVTGGKAADVEEAFTNISKAAGLTYDAMQTLRDATHGQIADFDLMKLENKDLGAGLKLTADQLKLMGDASYSLAKAQGIDLSDAMEKVNQALLTGRTRSIQMLIGRVDQTAAEEKFAARLGVTVAQLSAEGKVEAVREEVLTRLQGVTDKVGEAHERMADSIQKAAVWFQNLTEKIEIGINNSPVFTQAMLAIQNIMQSTFGGNTQGLVDAIVHKIEDLAISAVKLGQSMIPVAKTIIDGWTIVENMWQHIISGWDAVVYSVEAGVQLILKGFALLPGGTKLVGDSIQSLEADMESLYNSMAQRDKAVQDNNAADIEWNKSLDKLGTTVGIVANAMDTAKKGESDIIDVHKKNQDQIDKVSKSLDDNSKYLKDNSQNIQANKKELDAAGAAWTQYADLVAKASGNSFAAQKTDIENWLQDQISKLDIHTTTWKNHYDALVAIAKEKEDLIGINSAELYKNSRTQLEDNVTAAEKTYEFALQNAADYSQAYIQKLHDNVFAAQDAWRNYGNEAAAASQKAVDGTQAAIAALDKQIAEQEKLDAVITFKTDVDLTTAGGIGAFVALTGAMLNASTAQIEQLAQAGYSLQQLIQNGIITMKGQVATGAESVEDLLKAKGKGGSTGTSGPAAAPSTPTNNSGAAASGTNSNAVNIQGGLQFHINGVTDPKQIAEQVASIIVSKTTLTRKFGSA